MSTLGVDASHWQGYMLWDKAKEAGAEFGFFKATDFNSLTNKPFIDSQAVNNYNGTRGEGLINGAYGWLQPKIDPIVQAKHYCEFWHKHPTDFAIWDFEDTNVNSWSDMAWRGQASAEYIRDNIPVPLIIYTAQWYISKFGKIGNKLDWLSQYIDWVASYPGVDWWPTPVTTKYWHSWTFWQFSASGYGKEFGATQALSIDRNKFNGTLEQLRILAELDLPVPVDPPIDPENPGLTDVFQVNVPSQYVRVGPGIGYQVKTSLPSGTILTPVMNIEAVSFAEVWLEFPIGWVALTYGGRLYLKEVA